MRTNSIIRGHYFVLAATLTSSICQSRLVSRIDKIAFSAQFSAQDTVTWDPFAAGCGYRAGS